jgi:hypothetical protein
MNIIFKCFKRIFYCKLRSDHTVFLKFDELQVLSQTNLYKYCEVCGLRVVVEQKDKDHYYEIEDD